MSGFGLFEANVTSDAEQKRQVREASNKLAAATYDVRERFGQFLFAARDLAEYNDRLALSKNDILKTIEPHVFPRTGTVRRVLKPLEREFKSLRTAAPGAESGRFDDDSELLGGGGSFGSPKDGLGIGGVGQPGGSMSTITPAAKPTTPDKSGIGGVGGGDSMFNPNGYPVTQQQIDSIGGSDAFEGPGKGLGGGTPSGGSAAPGSPNDPQAFKDGGPGNETPSTDPIGPGEYTIQSGDTYSDLAQRAGWGDDYQGFADATGYQADNPDMIYAGDTMNVVAPPGSDSTASDAAAPAGDAAAPAADAPLAAESASTATPPPANETGSLTDPGLTTPDQMGQKLTSRRAARRRRADFERNLDTDETYTPSDAELEPEGDFKGWLDSVDQDAEGKVDRNFGGTFPGGTEHDGDPAKTDFAKSATRRFARWCKANRLTASLATLETYSPSDREYIAIAATLQRVTDAMGGTTPPVGMRDARNRRLSAPGVPGSKPKGPEWTSKGKPRGVNSKPDLGTVDDAPTGNLPGGTAVNKVHAARRRYAALCRQQGVRPTEAGFRRWAGKHNAPAGGRYYDPMKEPGGYGEAITNQKGERLAPGVGKHFAPEHATNEFGIHDSDFHRGDVAYPAELTQHDTAHGGRPTMKRTRIRDSRRRTALGDHWTTDSVRPTPYKKQDLGDWDGRGEDPSATFGEENEITLLPGTPLPIKGPKGVKFKHRDSRRRIAAPDYLQKADEALTNLLNQKAEEFQTQIAPLQQALQTVQQAEAEAQAANPLNVMPPAGTVNVLPQQPGGDPNGTDAGAGGGGMDPNALMALMGGGGGDPSMGGGDPAAGGGAPPGMDPSAMGGAPPAAAGQDALPPELMGGQQVQARRRGKARGGASPRVAKNVDQLWDEYTHQTTLRGGEPDVETFAQRYKVGPRALQRIRQKSMGG